MTDKIKKFKNKPIYVILLIVFLNVVAYGLLIPVVPLLLTKPDSSFYLLSPNSSTTIGYILFGLLTAIYPLMQFLSTPILGQLSDKYGRKKILILSVLGTVISLILFAIGIQIRNLELIFFARALDGLTGGNISVAQASIADVTPSEKRSSSFGTMGATFALGLILGPFIGGKLSDPGLVSWFNAATPFWFAAIVNIISVIALYFTFQETKKNKDTDKPLNWTQSINNIKDAFKTEKLKNIFIAAFVFYLGFNFYVSYFSVYLTNNFGFSQGSVGNFYSYIGIWGAITQGIITRNLAKKFPDYKIIRITLFLTSLGILLYFLPKAWWGLLLVVPFYSIPNGLTFSNLQGLISNCSSDDDHGNILGINASIQALAQSIPPIVAGVLAAKLNPTAPIIAASIIIFISAVIFNVMYKTNEEKAPQKSYSY